MRTGINVNCEHMGDWARVLAFIKATKPAYVLLMSDWDLRYARQVIEQTETKVIARFPSPNEADDWRYVDDVIYAMTGAWASLPNLYPDKILFNVLTEPNCDDEEIPALLNWLIRFGYVAGQRGLRCVLGNFSPGFVKPQHVDAGIYDDYLRFIGRNGGVHLAGYHEYAPPVMAGTAWPPPWLADKERVQPDRWPAGLPVRRYDGALPPYWSLLRSTWLDIRASEIGAGAHPKALTEWGWDRLMDLEDAGVYRELESRYGIPQGYPNIRGLETYRAVWADWWPEWSFEEAAWQQINWAERVYPASYLGWCLFTWSYHFEWAGYGFNIAPLSTLHEKMAGGIFAPPPDEEEPVGKTVDVLDYVRGDGRIYELRYEWAGGGTQRLQTQRDGRRFFQVKETQWEEMWHDDDCIYRGADTSPGDNQLYILFAPGSNAYGDKWCPRRMTEGQVYNRNPYVRFYYKDREEQTGVEGLQPSQIKFERWHATFHHPQGLAVSDVIELAWYDSGGRGPIERYWYARNYGLVGWQGGLGKAYIARELPGEPSLTREAVSWLKLPTLPGDQPAPSYPALDDPRWRNALAGATNANVRAEPNTSAPVRTIISGSLTVRVLAEAGQRMSDGLWLPIVAGGQAGWVRSDVITLTYADLPERRARRLTITLEYEATDDEDEAVTTAANIIMAGLSNLKLTNSTL